MRASQLRLGWPAPFTPRGTVLDAQVRRVAPLVILVAALHAALLAIPVRSARPHSAMTVSSPMLARVVEVRRLGTEPATQQVMADPKPWKLMSALVAPVELAKASLPTIPETPTLAATVAPPEVSPPLEALHLVGPGFDSDAEYYPRSMLSSAPTPGDMVDIDYPLIPGDTGHHVSELTLFIDETGRVARVRVDGDELPPALEAAARAAFLQARFRAGEADGKLVKSQIRVEVVFDDRPPARS